MNEKYREMAPGQARTEATIDEGLRSYMIGVYNYMTGGLALTAIVSYLMLSTGAVSALFTQTENGFAMNGLGWLVTLAPLGLVFAFHSVLKHSSLAVTQAVFWGFCALMGASLTPVLALYTGASIVRVFFITSITFMSMSLYGYTTKRDLTGLGSFLMMGLFGLIAASVVNMFLQSSGMHFVLSIIGVLIFTGLTAYNTQKIRETYHHVRGNSEIMAKSAVSGALSLYLDFINLFIYMLRFFGDRR